MPNRRYHGHEPPSLTDHVLAHPWEMVVTAFSVLAGVLAGLLTAAGSQVSPSVDRLPNPLVYALAVMLVAGGITAVKGLLDDSADLMVGYAWERFGLILTGCGWSIYALVVVVAYPGSIRSWGLGAALSLGAGLRLAATIYDQRHLRRMIWESES